MILSHYKSEQTAEPGGLWKAKQAARFLAISERHLWTLTQRGEVPAIRLGDCVRYDPADLRALIANCKQGQLK
jgi:predicted DNA-binding transcriptional regulator AlpA